jgi:Protein of unknown function (DUF1569)
VSLRTSINTRRAPRRTAPGGRPLSYPSVADLLLELDRIDAASQPGGEGLFVTGNWSVGQLCQHIAIVIKHSYDGFPDSIQVPTLMRFVARLGRGFILNRPMSPGFSVSFNQPGGPWSPDAQVWTDLGIALLRAQAERIRAGERMQQPSPLVGPLSNDEWTRLHLNHAALHLSFVNFGPVPAQTG